MMSQTKHGRAILAVVVLLVVALIGGLALHHRQPEPAAAASSSASTSVKPPATGPVKTAPAPASAIAKAIVITGTNASFNPKTITVKKGQAIKLTFKVAQGTHSLNIDALNLHTLPLSGSQDTVQFTASKAGHYEYYSSVGDDKRAGLSGTLIVE